MTFYRDQLGLDLISLVEGRHAFFRVGSSVLLCFLPEATKQETQLPPHYAEGPQHVAFEVNLADLDSSRRKIEAQGIEVTHTQEWGAGRYESFYFTDPSGNVLEIVPSGMWD